MVELPDRIKRLRVSIADNEDAGELLRDLKYVFRYGGDDAAQSAVSLLMPATQPIYDDGDLFASMDMNLPEGFLFQQIVDSFPKQPLSKMHLLALMGKNAIGRVGFNLPGRSAAPPAASISRATLLGQPLTPGSFADLVRAYLSTGVGISGVQPKIMLPSRASISIPDLIVKTAGAAYPGLAANEWMCLTAAAAAGIDVPRFDLSNDGQLLLIDRFDLAPDGRRLGFEDIAALMTLRVHDRLSSRKYQGSYEQVASVISLMSSAPAVDLATFFEQLCFSVMVRNGDAHLKNFGMLYGGEDANVRLSPMFDVVTTGIYLQERPGGISTVDRTLALKWRAGKRWAGREFPAAAELIDFGRAVCGVSRPKDVIERIAHGMQSTLQVTRRDERVGVSLHASMTSQWHIGLAEHG